ncbi:MAG: MBOAT family protein [Prevotella sp.]|nr:MBOAT family protein [Prevotella sp.]
MNELLDKILYQLTYHANEPLIFSTSLFLFLFLGFTLVYSLLERRLIARLCFVTLFSYFFYYKSSGFYFFLLAVVTVSDYLIAGVIYRHSQKHPERLTPRKWLLLLSLVIDLGLLGYFKYTNFFAKMVADCLGHNFQPMDIFLPVGISFFTFQSLSYTIDIYRGQLKPMHSLLDYAFYVSFFPQLVAGPIVRARDFAPQIRRVPVVTREMMGQGVYYIAIGLFKKCVISDYISLNFVDRVFDDPSIYSGVENLLGAYGYTLQIYCDFSGYSDMAIGMALLLGFHFPKNFNSPFVSTSVTEFWHRWHMSFSTWIRDYIYISMGGNRKGKVRTYVNLIVTMLIGGLWHGASLNFVAWGGLHGVALACHKFFRTNILHHDKQYVSHGIRRILAMVVTFHFVCFCFIFFRNVSFEKSIIMIQQIGTNFHPELFGEVMSGYRYVMLVMLLGFISHFLPVNWKNGAVKVLTKGGVLIDCLVLVAAIYLVIQVKSSTIQPFIYFQF